MNYQILSIFFFFFYCQSCFPAFTLFPLLNSHCLEWRALPAASRQTAFLWVLSFQLLIIQPLNSSREILRVALSLLIPGPWKWSSQREACPERSNTSSSEVVYVFELSVLTNSIPSRITSQFGLVFILLKVLLSCVSLKGGFMCTGAYAFMPQGWHAVSVCSPGERFY